MGKNEDVFQHELRNNQPSSLPVNEYLNEACDYAVAKRADQITRGKWQSPLFEFSRLAKGHPELATQPARQVVEAFRRWRRSRGGTFDYPSYADLFPGLESDEEAEMEILDIWDQKIRFPAGWGPLDEAVERARHEPFLVWEDNTYKGYVFFISIAGWLQRLVGDATILLPCRLVAEKMGCKHNTVAVYRRLAIQKGLLKVESEHRFRPDLGLSEATEFRFALQRFNEARAQVA